MEPNEALHGEHGLKPTLVVVSGRPGSGKSTLAAALARSLGWPLVSRDEVNTGMTDVLGACADKTTLAEQTLTAFSELLRLLAAHKVAFVAEAAFQNHRWQSALGPVLPGVEVRLVHCVVDPELAQERVRLRKGLDAPAGPTTVVGFDPLSLPVPSLTVSTVDGYDPPLADIVEFARS